VAESKSPGALAGASGAGKPSHATAAGFPIIAVHDGRDNVLTPAQLALAARAAQRIREYQRTSTAAMLEIGKLLNEVKAELPHGEFGRWLEGEVGWTQRTAQNYMRAAEAFIGKSETVSHLPPVTLYRLAAPSIPEGVREGALALIADPGNPPIADINEMVDRALCEARDAAKAAARAKRRAKLTPDEAAREARKEAQRLAALDREREEREAGRDRQRHAVNAFVLSLDDDQAEALRAVAETGDGFLLISAVKAALAARAAS
jgi:hypothetical protein